MDISPQNRILESGSRASWICLTDQHLFVNNYGDICIN